jgi:hypothetical protein
LLRLSVAAARTSSLHSPVAAESPLPPSLSTVTCENKLGVPYESYRMEKSG